MNIIIIEGDWNDADYNTAVNTISDANIKRVKSIVAKMKKLEIERTCPESWRDNYVKVPQSDLDFIESYIPHGYEGNNIHTIVSITIYNVASKRKLL